MTMRNGQWQVLETLVVLKNRWISLIGERLLDNKKNELTYWRVERSDSVIVIPIQKNMILLPNPVYRPGVGEMTHDFPGGRHNKNNQALDTAYSILERELHLTSTDVETINLLNKNPWLVDSSFSNQKLHVFEAILKNSAFVDPALLAVRCPTVQAEKILHMLVCLQCRCALLDWLYQNNQYKGKVENV